MTTSGLEPITRRQRAHLATIEEVKEVARRRLSAEGLAALSLRSVARDMGLVPSALYRYFPSHAHLLSALAADAADSLIEAVNQAQEVPSEDDYRGRWESAMRGYRNWVLGNEPGYRLNFGDAVSHQLPDTGNQDVLPRLIDAIGGNLAIAFDTGQLDIDAARLADSVWVSTRPDLIVSSLSEPMFVLTLTAWSSMHGLMAMEASGRLQTLGVPADQMFETHLQLVTSRMGFVQTV